MLTPGQASRPSMLATRPLPEILTSYQELLRKLSTEPVAWHLTNLLACARELEAAVVAYTPAELVPTMRAAAVIVQLVAQSVLRDMSALPDKLRATFLTLLLAFKNALGVGCQLASPEETEGINVLVTKATVALWERFSMPGMELVQATPTLQMRPQPSMRWVGGCCVDPQLQDMVFSSVIVALSESFFPLLNWNAMPALLVVPKGEFAFACSFSKVAAPAEPTPLHYFLLAIKGFDGPGTGSRQDARSCFQWGADMRLMLNGAEVPGFSSHTAGKPLPATDISHILKPGVNFLSLDGCCEANYIVAILRGSLVKMIRSDHHFLRLLRTVPTFDLVDGEGVPIPMELPYTVKLSDPLSGCRLRIPIRTRKCRHVECFDLLTFLNRCLRVPAWVCPICGVATTFQHLVADRFSIMILKELSSKPEVLELVVTSKPQESTLGSAENSCTV